MVNDLMKETSLRLLLSETFWLEPEHYQQAKELSNLFNGEAQQWQAYLTGLGTLAFADWLQERLPDCPVHGRSNKTAEVGALQVGEFKLRMIAVEHVLDEVVRIPKVAIQQPDLAAHFYVLLEVLEDQEQVMIRGFLRRDEMTICESPDPTLNENADCPFSLASFDAEMNHLVLYIQQLDPAFLPLPMAAAQETEAASQTPFNTTKTQLSRWLQGVIDEGWQTIEALINPEANLAWSTRNQPEKVRGGKLINFGLQLNNKSTVLLITVIPESEGKIGVSAQVLPAAGEQVLPPQLKLTLLSSKSNKVLQEVESRQQDNYIQLKPFKGKPGTRFSIEVSLGEVKIRETFEL
jgi:hypothetical protein